MLDVTTTSASVSLNPDSPSVRLLNVGSDLVFVRFGTGAQTATEQDYPLQPNVPEIINKGVGADTLAAIEIAGGGPGPVLYITTGTGS